MSASDTRIPVSADTRREIRILKAREDHDTYDETLAALVDGYNPADDRT